MELKQHFLISILLGLFVFQNAESAGTIDPVVKTKLGLIRGLRAPDGDYAMYMGIPFAYINVSNPFGPPLPNNGFDGTFEAFDNSAACPQSSLLNGESTGNLDCLRLNVFVPDIANSTNRLPVMIFIPGGAFELGQATEYRPGFLMRRDVIMASITYRVGPYGFMCLGTPEAPGNQGLKDQQIALQWIKNNIEEFGGDSNLITIFGESAGGSSVDLHLLFGDDDLYSRAIIESGSTFSQFGIQDGDALAAFKLASYLGHETNDVKEALSFLTTVDTNLVIAATSTLKLLFRPCVEKVFDNVQTFIYDHPINIKHHKAKNVPLLIGFNSQESLGWVLTRSPEMQKSLIRDYIKLFFNFNDEDLDFVEELIKHFYLGDNEINESSMFSMVDFDSDFTFLHPVTRTVKMHLDFGAPIIFQYVFCFNGSNNFGKHNLKINFGEAAHADELGYIFPITRNDNPTAEDQLMIERITTLWSNFAKYGNPTPETTDLLPVTWPPLTKDKRPYLRIDSELSVASRPFHDRMAFWDLFYKLYFKDQRGYRQPMKC